MEPAIRKLEAADCIAASRLINVVAETYVAPDFSAQGMRHFLAYVRPSALYERLEAGALLLGTFADEQLIAVLEIRDGSHISLLFTASEWHGRGLAKKLLQKALDQITATYGMPKALTVNASPYAVPIYQKLGFAICGQEDIRNGVRFIPMIKTL